VIFIFLNNLPIPQQGRSCQFFINQKICHQGVLHGPEDKKIPRQTTLLAVTILAFFSLFRFAVACDLPEIREKGVLRHLGIPYANFVTGHGDGMDVELVKLFAQHLGVRYEYVKTSWGTCIEDLTGLKVKTQHDNVQILGKMPVRGDIIANGFTILPWREKVVAFSQPIFPTQVWLIARADSSVKPIMPTGKIDQDIAATKKLIKRHTLLGKANTCLDPSLYKLEQTGVKVNLFQGDLNELAPAIINGEAEMTLLDVPDALIALDKWPGQIKVLGPITAEQTMAYGFAKTSPQLLKAFNTFLEICRKDGTYLELVKKYYPFVMDYYPAFFKMDKLHQ
jgi:ABC-type amino acid transport substrate-binding protein